MLSVVDPLLRCQKELNSWDVLSQNQTEKPVRSVKIIMQIVFWIFLRQSKQKPDWLSSAKNYFLQKWHFHGILKWIAIIVVRLSISLSVCLSVIRISLEPFIWSTSLFTGLLLGTQWSAVSNVVQFGHVTNQISFQFEYPSRGGIRRKQSGD